MRDPLLSTKQKAQKINLSGYYYGTFAEIGAGQEVARHFFQAGGASGLIAKTISAYDMIFSDHIYGKETSGRYVCESRLRKMLDKEYDLLDERLHDIKGKDHCFFVFSDTVAALNFSRTNEAHGWLGVKFQTTPGGEASEVLIHVRMLDPQNLLQQAALGIIGVNLIYACMFQHSDPKEMIISLMDHLDSTRMEINFIKCSGPLFKNWDDRLLNLQLLREGFTNAVMFNESGDVILASENLYKNNVLIVRGSYRPPTLVSLDMIKSGKTEFAKSIKVDESKIDAISELTLSILAEGGHTNEDFLARVDLLATLGMKVLVTNYPQYYKLSSFVARYNKSPIGLVLGVYNFQQIFDENYSNVEGELLASLGQLFRKNVHVFVYPYMSEDKKEFTTLENLKVPENTRELFEHLKKNHNIKGISKYTEGFLHIYSRKVLNMIAKSESGWEEMLPPTITKTIQKKALFGYTKEKNK